jgi:cysteine desulfurase/selenocysteine lyase
VLQAQLDVLRRSEVDPYSPWPSQYPGPQEARPKLAGLLNAQLSEIAFTRNSTESMNIIAMGLDLKPEDEILTTTHEHYGGWSCWQNRHDQFGNPIRKIDLHDPPEDEDGLVRLFEAAIRPETKVLSFCHVTCTTAWRFPVKQICAMARERGIITVVDGAQSVGMIQVDVKDLGCDFYVSSTHKWLFTPKGTGFLYIRQDVEDRIGLGYHTHRGRGAQLTAFRFENHASQSPAPLVGFAVAVDFHNAVGTSLIEERGAAMASYLKTGLAAIPGVRVLTPMSRFLSASMVSISIGGMTSGDVCTPLRQKYNIETRGLHEGGYHGARISCAIHNTYEELDAVIRAVAEIAANRC